MNLTFDINEPDEVNKVKLMLSADSMQAALWSVAMDVFRPARKHGYADSEIAVFFDETSGISDAEITARHDLVYALEQKFYKILEQYDVSIEG